MSTATAPPVQEQDLRLGILNSLMTCPHGNLDEVLSLHADLVERDPLFYSRLAAWYEAGGGDIRDHQMAFVITLCQSAFEGHRDIGCAMLREMHPKQVCRVIDYLRGMIRVERREVKRGERSVMRNVPVRQKPTAKLPTPVRTEVRRYLQEREADDDWFDSVVLSARRHMKSLYATTKTYTSDRARDVLFLGKAPEGSKIAQMRALSTAATPADQAKAIVEHKVPYRIAASVITQMTPAVILALVEVMTPQELVTNFGSLKRRGAMNVPEIKERVLAKLEKAKTSKGVAALKSQRAAEVTNLSAEEKVVMDEIADSQVKAKGRIAVDTLLLVDKSYSMEQAISCSKRLCPIVSAIMDAELTVYAFDNVPYQINCSGTKLADWEKAFRGIRAGGGTCIGGGLAAMQKAVDQIVIVSDGGENGSPRFTQAYAQYCQRLGVTPNVVFIRIPGDPDTLSRTLIEAEIAHDTWDFATDDYYALPQVIPLLTKQSKFDLLLEIMQTPLPVRKAS